jgi:hypothetical protein
MSYKVFLGKYGCKYVDLGNYLKKLETDEATMKFAEIEKIISYENTVIKLPKSAY